MRAPSKRIFGIAARDAPIVAVLSRGPSAWTHLGRWDLERDVYEPGDWLKARVYPQRCDLTADGRLLSYFAHGRRAFLAVSEVPSFTPVAHWPADSTWTLGFAFGPATSDLLVEGYGLHHKQSLSFAVERVNGWAETADSAPSPSQRAFDSTRRETEIVGKTRPGHGGPHLTARGEFAARREIGWGEEFVTDYRLDTAPLTDVQWAEWDPRGRLLVATRDGQLQVRDSTDGTTVAWEYDLAALAPDAV